MRVDRGASNARCLHQLQNLNEAELPRVAVLKIQSRASRLGQSTASTQKNDLVASIYKKDRTTEEDHLTSNRKTSQHNHHLNDIATTMLLRQSLRSVIIAAGSIVILQILHSNGTTFVYSFSSPLPSRNGHALLSNKRPTILQKATTTKVPRSQNSDIRHSTQLSAMMPQQLPAMLAWVPWKQVGMGLITIPNNNRWILYFTCFIACHAQILWPLAYINQKKSTARITLGVLMISMLKLMFGPPWTSFLVMCYSLGLFIWADFVSDDGRGPPLPPFIFKVLGLMATLSSLTAMGVFPTLSTF